jgi:ABC-type transporter Mla MlaB component
VANAQPLPVPPGQPVMVLGGRIDPADIPTLCGRARDLLASSGKWTLRCEVRSLQADAATLDALARIALLCRRLGRTLELQGASVELEELVVFAGLTEVLPCLPGRQERQPPSGLQPRRQPEQRKEARRVEEERDPCDPIT